MRKRFYQNNDQDCGWAMNKTHLAFSAFFAVSSLNFSSRSRTFLFAFIDITNYYCYSLGCLIMIAVSPS